MVISWTPHRFSGGALALDVANTVVMCGDPNGFDRFADVQEIARFASAASQIRAAELGGHTLVVEDADAIAPTVLSIRETTDRLFRTQAKDGSMASADLAALLSACAAGLAGSSIDMASLRDLRGEGSAIPMPVALAASALSLLSQERATRIRICANCRWLFLDESRNRSRIWCDMAVCGNRQKAKRHYQRRAAGRKGYDA